MSLNKLVPQFDEYQLLLHNSQPLQESIYTFHASIVQLCKEIIRLTRQPCTQQYYLMADFTNLETKGMKKITTDLRSKLQPQIKNIQSCSNDVEKAITLAKFKSDRREQEKQEQERKLSANHRKEISIFASQTRKKDRSIRERQIQSEQELLSRYLARCQYHANKDRREEKTTSKLFINIQIPNKL